MVNGTTGSMLSILPPIVIGGAALMFTERFMGGPQKGSRRRPFDKLERKDKKEKSRELSFGDFRNINY